MKKIILTISLISVLFLVGCEKNQEVNNEVMGNTDNQNQENIINSGENVSGEIIEEEHINPYMMYSRGLYYTVQNYEEYIESFVNIDEETSVDLARSPIELLQLLRNLPFAMKGHDFKDADLAEFFNKEDWYKKVEGKQVALSELNSNEQKFLSIVDAQIKKHRETMNSVPKYEYDPNKEIVYSFYSFGSRYGQEEGYNFPYINIDSENIKKLNNEIYDWAMPIILGTYFECSFAEYKYYLNDNILTVIIEEKYGYGGKSGFHYNIDVETGEFISNLDVLAIKGIEIEKIPNLKEKLSKSKIVKDDNVEWNGATLLEEYCSHFGNYMEYAGNEILENPEKWTLIYLDNEQKIHVILELPTLAGATDGTDFIDCIVEF